MGSKIKRSFGSTCNGDKSTSTLDQHSKSYLEEPSFAPSELPTSSSCTTCPNNVLPRKSVTLEEMLVQLESEEEKAMREKAANDIHKDKGHYEDKLNFHRRMSCVNNSDILRSSRNALNQYPRFSLDSRDAMYRSSLHNDTVGERAIDGLKLGRILHLPQSLGGESVIWCKPGVVPKLMGLEAMPLPISRLYSSGHSKNKRSKETLCNTVRSQNLRIKIKRNEMEGKRRRHAMDSKVSYHNTKRIERVDGGGNTSGSCSHSIKLGL